MVLAAAWRGTAQAQAHSDDTARQASKLLKTLGKTPHRTWIRSTSSSRGSSSTTCSRSACSARSRAMRSRVPSGARPMDADATPSSPASAAPPASPRAARAARRSSASICRFSALRQQGFDGKRQAGHPERGRDLFMSTLPTAAQCREPRIGTTPASYGTGPSGVMWRADAVRHAPGCNAPGDLADMIQTSTTSTTALGGRNQRSAAPAALQAGPPLGDRQQHEC